MSPEPAPSRRAPKGRPADHRPVEGGGAQLGDGLAVARCASSCSSGPLAQSFPQARRRWFGAMLPVLILVLGALVSIAQLTLGSKAEINFGSETKIAPDPGEHN